MTKLRSASFSPADRRGHERNQTADAEQEYQQDQDAGPCEGALWAAAGGRHSWPASIGGTSSTPHQPDLKRPSVTVPTNNCVR
jgi:hypothetical protein